MVVTAMPEPAPFYDAEAVFLLDAEGNIQQTWRVPIDFVPTGVDGGDLHLFYGPGERLIVGRDGGLRLRSADEFVPAQIVECPDRFERFGASAYKRCIHLPDTDGMLLAYQGPCT